MANKITNISKRAGKGTAQIAQFWQEFRTYKRLSAKNNRFPVSWKNIKPQLHDRTTDTGFDRHYIYHPAWAARVLAKTKPQVHVDISSTLHFCSIVSAFLPVEFYDYRPANLQLSNLQSKHADLLKLPFKNKSIPSLSCMHTIEHVGLGRYGDPIDPDSDLKAIAELKRVLADNGDLLFVVPIGKPQVYFNAHRVYSYDQICSYFKEFSLKEFALIPERPTQGELLINPQKSLVDQETYACGCFWFRRKK